jgi:hypothetical protein
MRERLGDEEGVDLVYGEFYYKLALEVWGGTHQRRVSFLKVC